MITQKDINEVMEILKLQKDLRDQPEGSIVGFAADPLANADYNQNKQAVRHNVIADYLRRLFPKEEPAVGYLGGGVLQESPEEGTFTIKKHYSFYHDPCLAWVPIYLHMLDAMAAGFPHPLIMPVTREQALAFLWLVEEIDGNYISH